MPKKVDHDERRRVLAEAVFAVIGTRGFDAVGLRDVAAEAGVSMGSVQHYFTSKDEMLLFALEQQRTRVLARMQAALGGLVDPTRRDTISAAIRAMLPLDDAGRQETCVNVAFVSAATVNPIYAEMLREGYARLLAVSRAQLRAAEQAGELAEGIDPDREAAALYFLAQGLIAPVLIGLFSAEDALGLLSHQLDRIFR